MNFWNLVYRAAEYGIILPGIFLCIIPVADWLIIPQRKLYPVLLPCMVAVCFVLAWWTLPAPTTQTYSSSLCSASV